eukprot:4365394-Pyramimonas_sp.AAC.1
MFCLTASRDALGASRQRRKLACESGGAPNMFSCNVFSCIGVDGLFMSPNQGGRVHIIGGWAQPTHSSNVRSDLG